MTADGLLLVDKPKGLTSHDVVDLERRVRGTRKIGHAGTLDPMATGLLLVGVGRATRLLRYLSALDKTYDGTARLGEETDTLDADGEIVRTQPVTVALGEIQLACAALVGASLQTPPTYSAVKVAGRKLVDAARRGEQLRASPRPITVHAFDVERLRGRDVDVHVRCSSGTYVRVLIADVGTALGCGAHLIRLRRMAIGPFDVASAALPGQGTLLPLERAVEHLPSVALDQDEAEAASHGTVLAPAGIDGPYAVLGPGSRLVGVYRDQGAKARPEVVLARG